MAVSVHDSVVRVADGEALGSTLAVDVILSSTVDGEVRRLVDESSSLGVGSGGRGVPVGTAEVDHSSAVEIG